MTGFTESLRAQCSRPTVIDLFSGAGGTGLGFQRAGFDIVGAVEIDPYASETYEKNLHVNVKRVDIRELSPQAFRRELELDLGELDVLVGCPPCQGFSRMRNHKGVEDGRNDLVLRYLEYVEAFMPRFAVFENVPGLIRTEHGRKFYRLLIEGLIRLGYGLTEREEDIADYGIAQHRKRVVVIAGRDREKPLFPKQTHGKPGTQEIAEGLYRPWLTVWDVVGNNKYPSLKAGENGEQTGKYPNHIAPVITESRVLEFIKMVPHDGGGRKDVEKRFWLQCHLTHDGHADVYGRLAWHRPANTITAGCTNLSKGRFVHPEQDRSLTAREAAALQGFPDDYVFYGGNFASQIGNAVPPPLAYAIATLLKAILDQEKSTRRTNNHLAADTPHTLGASHDR
jgi:DNA (cytosine-5)-methyltransferase 1